MDRRKLNLVDPVILVKVVGDTDGGWDPTKGSSVRCLLCGLTDDISTESTTKQDVIVQEGKSDRLITIANFRPNIPRVGHYYLAYRFGNSYILDNQEVFLEFTTTA